MLHTFNLLDARGAISVAERTAYIHRVRDLARKAAAAYMGQRESMGFPLLNKFSEKKQAKPGIRKSQSGKGPKKSSKRKGNGNAT